MAKATYWHLFRQPCVIVQEGEAMRTLLICLLAPAVALAQDNPLTAFGKLAYRSVEDVLLRSPEKMPRSFKPTDAVRSFGQVVGHVADAQYLFYSIVLREKNPAPKNRADKNLER